MLAESPRGELRVRSSDERLQKDCAKAGDWYCLDVFYRLESAAPDEVVVRFRMVATTDEEARIVQKGLNKMVLLTEDGRRVRAELSPRFEVRPIPNLRYSDDGSIKTGRIVYRRQPDGSVIQEDEWYLGTVMRETKRVIGSNFIVFKGTNLISPTSKNLVFEFEKGLLGGGARWVFDFVGAEVRNATLAVNEPGI